MLASASVLAQAPAVSTVTPAKGATGVALDSTLVFTFSTAMEDVPVVPSFPGVFVGSIEFTPATVPIFDCEWSGDFRTLTCTPSDELPANTTINWKLNPTGVFLPLKSAGGVVLPQTTGSFATGAGGGGGGGGGENPNAPKLVSSTPANGAREVPGTASVQFVFDRAMKKEPKIGGAPPSLIGGVQWLGQGLDPAKFTYVWSADGTTLTCEYQGDLPGSTQVSWVLNAPLAFVRLTSEAGVELPQGTYSGGFFTAAGSGGGGGGNCDPNGVPGDWGFYSVSKMFQYQQTGAGDPVRGGDDAFQFGAVIREPTAGPAVTAGKVTVPPSTTQDLTGSPFGGFQFFNDTKPSVAELQAAYPGGNYILRFTQTGQAERVIAMTMPGTVPPVPKIANFAEAQAANATLDFTLRWNAFTGATAKDGISLTISDSGRVVFQAPDLCVPRELAATATSIVIPANTLAVGKTYQASLSFNQVFYNVTNAIPNMGGYGAVTSSTDFTIKAVAGGGPGPAQPARFTAYKLLENGHPQLTLTGTATRVYTIQRATQLSPGNWQTAGVVTMNAAGSAVYEDGQAGTAFPIFYRAVAN